MAHRRLDLLLALLLGKTPMSSKFNDTPLMHGVDFRLWTTRVWKQPALPLREAIINYARNGSQNPRKDYTESANGITAGSYFTCSVPSPSELSFNGPTVATPVAVPPPDRAGMVNAHGFETGIVGILGRKKAKSFVLTLALLPLKKSAVSRLLT